VTQLKKKKKKKFKRSLSVSFFLHPFSFLPQPFSLFRTPLPATPTLYNRTPSSPQSTPSPLPTHFFSGNGYVNDYFPSFRFRYGISDVAVFISVNFVTSVLRSPHQNVVTVPPTTHHHHHHHHHPLLRQLP